MKMNQMLHCGEQEIKMFEKDLGLGKCRYRNFKPCIGHDCESYIQMQGVHPQTGETVSEWKCSDTWNIILKMEGNKQNIEMAAAIESLRNVQDTQIKELALYLGGILVEQKESIIKSIGLLPETIKEKVINHQNDE